MSSRGDVQLSNLIIITNDLHGGIEGALGELESYKIVQIQDSVLCVSSEGKDFVRTIFNGQCPQYSTFLLTGGECSCGGCDPVLSSSQW